jgi:adenine phosphoribosyltransferase
MIRQKLKSTIREVRDFPKPGISFKDITPILSDSELSLQVVDAFVQKLQNTDVDAVAGVESRGFLFGMMLANALKVPFIPIRKAGKLPADTISEEYNLEYGTATLEIHKDAVQQNWNIVVHDDLLATGGTADATSKLITKLGAKVSAFAFVVELDFLNGKQVLNPISDNIISLINY